MRTVVFDLDGTLADTSGDLIAAANSCFDAMGAGALLDPVEDAVTAFKGGRAMLALGLSRMGRQAGADVIAQWYPRLLESYAASIARHTRLYPGVEDALETLARRGVRLSVCTNKPEALAIRLLRELSVFDAFGAIVGADTLPTKKPDPAPYAASVSRAGGALGQSCLVGDTVTDRDTARAAGVPSVLVAFGAAGREAMSELTPDALLEAFADLPDLFDRLVPPDVALGERRHRD